MHDKSPQILRAVLDAAEKRVLELGNLCDNIVANEGNAEFLTLAQRVYGISDCTTAARAYFAGWEALIALYSAPENWTGSGVPNAAIKSDVMRELGHLCGHLAVGNIPPLIKNASGPGRKKPGPEERQDMEIAVTYVAAVRAGKIGDKAPVKTVMRNFGVNRRTYEGWANEFRAIDFENAYPKIIKSKMKQAGARYRKAGRSHSAINIRAKKQRGAAN
jgi:hypothetical protein